METWKAVPDTNGMIEVSDRGRVRSWLRGSERILKTCKDKKGYHRLRVTLERKKLSYKLHRLVAQAFIENPNNLPQVNHIDGNKDNNDVTNLEWVSNKENAHHAIRSGLWDSVLEGSIRENKSREKPIVGMKDGVEKHFKSVSEAERFLNSRHISDVLKGKRQHVKGWSFAYEGR